MGEVVNLRLARKRKARAAQDIQAAANRALHGRTKAEKAEEKAARQRGEALLDGHRLERPGDDDRK
ncbi:MAG: DUF4169 family protein [Mesorhizobium sp.]|nr:DUF4169 family protein [Mesorhizobium sp.]